jgi:hypothetical protein
LPRTGVSLQSSGRLPCGYDRIKHSCGISTRVKIGLIVRSAKICGLYDAKWWLLRRCGKKKEEGRRKKERVRRRNEEVGLRRNT